MLALVLGALAAVPAHAAQGGQLFAFGLNDYGQLGRTANNGATTANPTPTSVTLPNANGAVARIAAGGSHTLVVMSSDQLFAFGYNFEGQLGRPANNNTYNPNPKPALVALPGRAGRIVELAAGGRHSLALTSAGQLYAFGYNAMGQLGNSTNNGTYNPNLPGQVSLPGKNGRIVHVAAGSDFTLATTSSDQLYGFGDNQYGELGNATNNGSHAANPTPTLITLPGKNGTISQIAAGTDHSAVLTSTGQLYTFGGNYYGQLGNSTNSGTSNPNPTPATVSLPASSGKIVQIAAGSSHTLALTSTGKLYAWGYNFEGQLGNTTNNNTFNPNPTPALVGLPSGSGAPRQIAAGDRDTLVLTSSGRLYTFGYNGFGQLGRGANTGTYNPNPPAPLVLPAAAGTAITAFSRGSQADHTLVARVSRTPALTGVRATPRKSSATGRVVGGHCVRRSGKNSKKKHCKLKIRVRIAYTLNIPARVRIALSRTVSGRKAKGRCVRQTKKNKKHRSCKRRVSAGRKTVAGKAGANSVTIGPRTFKPGKYSATLVATANGQRSGPRAARFKVGK